MGPPDPEQLLEPFRFLIGTWSGLGTGLWDPAHPFSYREVLVLEPVPDRALIHLSQRTVAADTGFLSHSEQGYLRLFPGGAIELLVAVPAGYLELHHGRLEGHRLTFELLSLTVSPTARPLGRTLRSLELLQERLHHIIQIGVGETVPQPHVSSVLERV